MGYYYYGGKSLQWDASARAHVHMHPTVDICKTFSQWVSNHTPNFSAIRPAVSKIQKWGTPARMHVQVFATYDLCNMHRCLVSNHMPDLVTIGQPIPELQLSSQF